MRKSISISIVITFSFLLPVISQVSQSTFIDLGSSTISSGAYVRAASVTAYRINNYEARLGLQGTISGADRTIISGFFIDAGVDFDIHDFPVSATLFFRYNPYSSLISETNIGMVASHYRDHLEVHLGYNSRIYSMTEKAMDVSDLPDPDLHIYEWRNFMYKGILWLKPIENKWNIGGSLTNFDHFLIQQETNPILTALFQYDFNSNWRINSELWYQGAGMLNLASNYYGFYFRTGFIWQIN